MPGCLKSPMPGTIPPGCGIPNGGGPIGNLGGTPGTARGGGKRPVIGGGGSTGFVPILPALKAAAGEEN